MASKDPQAAWVEGKVYRISGPWAQHGHKYFRPQSRAITAPEPEYPHERSVDPSWIHLGQPVGAFPQSGTAWAQPILVEPLAITQSAWSLPRSQPWSPGLSRRKWFREHPPIHVRSLTISRANQATPQPGSCARFPAVQPAIWGMLPSQSMEPLGQQSKGRGTESIVCGSAIYCLVHGDILIEGEPGDGSGGNTA